MMKILSRYVLKESAGPFVFGLSVITLVLIMDFLVDIMNLIINRGVRPLSVIELFAMNLAWMLALSVPMAVMVAALMVFGRLASDNEITASRALGVSFYRLLIPMLGAGIVLTALMIWFNDRVLPEANHRARMLLTDITRKKPTWSLEENIFLNHFEGYSIRVKTIARETSEIADIIIIQTINAERIITAKRGKMFFDDNGTTLMLELEDGEILEVDSKEGEGITRTDFVKQIIAIPGASSELERTSQSARGDREMTVGMMLEQNRERRDLVEDTIKRTDSLTAAAISAIFNPGKNGTAGTRPRSRAVNSAYNANRDILGKLTFIARTAENYNREINSMNVEIHKKFSIPAACIAFILIGAPLGSIARKGGFATGIALSLFFFIVYWAFLIGGEQLADKGKLPAFWAMWLPNFTIGGIGILLGIAFVRQTAFVSTVQTIQSFFTAKLNRTTGRANENSR